MAIYEEEEAAEEVAPKDLDDKSLKAFIAFFKTLPQVRLAARAAPLPGRPWVLLGAGLLCCTSAAASAFCHGA